MSCPVTYDLNRHLAELDRMEAYDDAIAEAAHQLEKDILADDTELSRLFNEDFLAHITAQQAAHAIRELFKGNGSPMAAIFQGTLDAVIAEAALQEVGVYE